jgi:hypothetical protein
MAHDVFVSYSHKDKPVADAVVAGLEKKGIRCWIAPRDVTPGTSWGDAIIGAIEACKIMIVILSANSNQSRQVVREVERAVANGVIIIPFRIEKIDPTGAMAYFLSTEHWLDAITPPLEEHIEKLGNTVQLFLTEGGRLDVAGHPGEAGVAQAAPAPRLQLVSFIAVILLGIITLVVLGIWLRPRLLSGSPTSLPTSPTIMAAPTETALPPTPTSTVIPTPTEVPPPEFKVIGEYRTSGSANGLFVVGNRLYLANGGNGLLELDVSDQSNPKLIDTYQVGDLPAQRLFMDGEIAYVIAGDTWRQLVILSLDTTGPSATFPAEGTSQVAVTGPHNITVADNLAHLTGHNYWGILDVRDPVQPVEIWQWEPPSHSGTPCNAAVDGSLAFIGCGWAGLFIFDITDPQNPALMGQFETPDWIIDIAVAEDVLYLTLGNSGLLTLDVSDPAQPLLLSRLSLPGFSNHLSVAGDTLYVLYIVLEDNVLQQSGVRAVNVSDPEAMEVVATYDKLDWASDIQAVEEDIYVADEARGVIIFNLDIIE